MLFLSISLVCHQIGLGMYRYWRQSIYQFTQPKLSALDFDQYIGTSLKGSSCIIPGHPVKIYRRHSTLRLIETEKHTLIHCTRMKIRNVYEWVIRGAYRSGALLSGMVTLAPNCKTRRQPVYQKYKWFHNWVWWLVGWLVGHTHKIATIFKCNFVNFQFIHFGNGGLVGRSINGWWILCW